MSNFNDLQLPSPQRQVQFSLNPVAQFNSTYGPPPQLQEFTRDGATVSTASEDALTLQTGVTSGAFARIKTQTAARARPGQSIICMFSAIFDSVNAVANSVQLVGPITEECGFAVGYDGTEFGVLHRNDGHLGVHRLTISAAASGAETITLTLDDEVYSFSVSKTSASANAYEIAYYISVTSELWEAYSNQNTVTFRARFAQDHPGTFSVSSSGTLAGTIAEIHEGQACNDNWTPINLWSVDPLNRRGPSGVDIDLTKGNVWMFHIPTMGFDPVELYVKSPEGGTWALVHRFIFGNTLTAVNLINPSLYLAASAESKGSTTNLSLKVFTGLLAIQGVIHARQRTRSTFTTKNVGGTAVPVLSIRNRPELRTAANFKELIPTKITVSTDAGKPVLIRVLINPVYESGAVVPNWSYVFSTESVAEVDTAATLLSSEGQAVDTFTVTAAGKHELKFRDLATDPDLLPLVLFNGEVLCVTAQVTSGGSAANVVVTVSWVED